MLAPMPYVPSAVVLLTLVTFACWYSKAPMSTSTPEMRGKPVPR
jgi:hypothetical protein